MPSHEDTNIDQNREPEGMHETLLVRLVAQELLGNQRPRPTTCQRQKVKRLFYSSPAARYRCGLVKSICEECHEA